MLDWKDMPEGNEKRQAYYCSREWSVKKEAVKERSAGCCERCKRNAGQVTHHLSYIHLYDERLDELANWCLECHGFVHGKPGSKDPLEIIKRELLESRPLCITEAYSERSLVRCPYCNSANVHMDSATWESESEDGNQGRVVVKMWGECPHEWEMVFVGHKGTLEAFTRNATSKL